MNKCLEFDCENIVEGNTNYCATHNFEHRRAERNAKKVKIVHQVKKVSESKAQELKEYNKLKKQFLETKMACEMRLPGCFLNSFDIHHCSKSESNFLNTNTWLAVCRSCHKKLEDLPAEERRLKGLLTD